MKGIFKPKNPKKYKGSLNEIVYRSSWELKYMMELDNNPKILLWGSETIIIPYRSPVDNKIHRYFVDFIVTEINTKGEKEISLIEIKPYKQTQQPKKRDKITKRYLTEVATWGVNKAKWDAAETFCAARGWKFKIYTEKSLNIPLWEK